MPLESELSSQPERAIQALEVKLALARGETPSLKNYQTLVAWHDQQTAIALLNKCPRGFYVKLSKRPNRSLDDQVALYGVPAAGGSPIDVVRVLEWFHTFLAKHGPTLKRVSESKDRANELVATKIETEIEMMNSKLVSLRIDIEKKQGTAVPIEEVRHAFTWLSNEWRKFGERLGKKFGADSQRFLNDFLQRVERDAVNYVPVEGDVAAQQADSDGDSLDLESGSLDLESA